MKAAKKEALESIKKAAKKAMLGDKYKGEDKPALVLQIAICPKSEEDEELEDELEDD